MKKMKDIMSEDIVTITKQEDVYEIAKKMKDHTIGFIPVVEGKKLVGVVTDRDLVLRGYADRKEGTTSAEQVMTRDVVTAEQETTVDEAAKLLAQNQIRRLPIVENDELVGVVAIGDLAVRENFDDEAGEALSKISEPQFASTK